MSTIIIIECISRSIKVTNSVHYLFIYLRANSAVQRSVTMAAQVQKSNKQKRDEHNPKQHKSKTLK